MTFRNAFFVARNSWHDGCYLYKLCRVAWFYSKTVKRCSKSTRQEYLFFTDPILGRDMMAGQWRDKMTWSKVIACSIGRCVLQSPDSPVFLAGTAKSYVRVDVGVVVPDAKFNIFGRPHISERAPFSQIT